MKMKYVGRRESICHSFEGEKYYFGPENKKIMDVPDVFSRKLLQIGDYIPVLSEAVVEKKVEVAPKKVKIAPKKKVA